MIIPLEEEYGYRIWIWKYPGTKKELIKDWKDGKTPFNFHGLSYKNYPGDIIPISMEDFEWWFEMWKTSYIRCHVHDDDTFLTVGKESYLTPCFSSGA